MSANEGPPVRVLVSGDVEGRFDALFRRVSQVNAKVGPFDLLFCVGEFLAPDADTNARLLGGDIAAPIPTYFVGPSSSKTAPFYPKETAELAPNLTYLGCKGQLTTANGLSVAYLAGRQSDEPDADSAGCFTGETVAELLVPATAAASFNGVDVLLTCEWPADVDKHATRRPTRPVAGAPLVSRAAAVLKPRYHFAALEGVSYERAPYRNHRVLQETAAQATRFVALAAVGAPTKWLYAFNVAPMKRLSRSRLVEQPADVSEFPYAETLRALAARRPADADAAAKPQFFFDMHAPMDDAADPRAQSRKRQWQDNDDAAEKRPPAPCWFCLSSPDVEKHLVVSVADCCYLALAKGSLTPDHVLILPVEHVQSVVSAAEKVRAEIGRYQAALSDYFLLRKQRVVFFERNYRTQHLQVQAVGVPLEAESGVRAAFDAAAEQRNVQLTALGKDQQLWHVVNAGCPYFSAQLPDGTRLFTRQMRNFPVQFGREVLTSASLLNAPEKTDWRACELGKEKETALAEQFRKNFAAFDIAQGDDSD